MKIETNIDKKIVRCYDGNKDKCNDEILNIFYKIKIYLNGRKMRWNKTKPDINPDMKEISLWHQERNLSNV